LTTRATVGSLELLDYVSIYILFSKMSQAPHLLATFDKLKISPQGKKFLTQALYPPLKQSDASIPDPTWDDTMRWHAAPTRTFTTPQTETPAAWDMFIVSHPGDTNAFIVARAPSPADFSATETPPGALVDVVPLSSIGDAIECPYYCYDDNATTYPHAYANAGNIATFRTVGSGIKVECSASSLYNGGTLTAGQFCRPPQAPTTC